MATRPNYSEIRVKGTARADGSGGAGGSGGGAPKPPACTVSLGSGSGTLAIDATKAHAGDVVCVKAGTYSGGTFANLSNVTILPAGPITFTGTIGIQNNKGLTIDGTFVPGATYGFNVPNREARVRPRHGAVREQPGPHDPRREVRRHDDRDRRWKPHHVRRHPRDALFSNLTIDTVKLSGASSVYSGSWEAASTYHNVVMGMTLTNVVIENDPTVSSTKVFGNSLYHLVADRWTITGDTAADNTQTDHGIFQIQSGNVRISNVYRNGGFGYIARVWNVSLGQPWDSYFTNIVDVNTVEYGTVDVRVEPGQMKNASASLPLFGNGVHIFNVTAGNKKTRIINGKPGYWSPMAIVGAMNDGNHIYDVEIRNCFAFNNDEQDHKGSLYRNYSPNDTHLSLSNNVAVEGPLPSGYLADQTKFTPLATGPLADKGVVIAQTANDVYGKSRGATYDIGAVEALSSKRRAGRGPQGLRPLCHRSARACKMRLGPRRLGDCALEWIAGMGKGRVPFPGTTSRIVPNGRRRDRSTSGSSSAMARASASFARCRREARRASSRRPRCRATKLRRRDDRAVLLAKLLGARASQSRFSIVAGDASSVSCASWSAASPRLRPTRRLLHALDSGLITVIQAMHSEAESFGSAWELPSR